MISLFLLDKGEAVAKSGGGNLQPIIKDADLPDIANVRKVVNNTIYLAIFGKFADLWQVMLQGCIFALGL